MKLLITTQTLDKDDLVLGFFHEWIGGLSSRFDSIEVICLKEGKHALPANVRVHSLGKERGAHSRAAYAWRFIQLAWKLRREYDAVFVHMNQEYILLAGWLWKLLEKRIFMWRNHYDGSLATDVAAAFCTRVFCTSKHSYTAKYEKTIIMPVGVDTALFKPDPSIERVPRSILSFGRIAPSKHVEVLIEALSILRKQGDSFTAAIYGDALPEHAAYLASLKRLTAAAGLTEDVSFHPGVPKRNAPAVFNVFLVYVNTSPSGMFDKTLFEAALAGCNVLAESEDFGALAGEQHRYASGDAADLARKLSVLLAEPAPASLAEMAEAQSVPALIAKVASVIL